MAVSCIRGVALMAALTALLGCEEPALFGDPTASVCPDGSALTYENFGQPFMERYCTRCHDSSLVGAARMGATSFHDFDTVFGVRAVKDHIDMTTASGPHTTNSQMPPSEPRPTLDERRQLGEWLACDAPGGE